MIVVSRTPVVVETPDETTSRPPRPQFTWTWAADWLERSWELTNPRSPVVKLAGATGIGQADPTHWFTEAPTIDGASWEGYRTGSGEVFLPLLVQGDDYETFQAEHDAFMASLNPGREGVLRVTRPDGRWREVACRYTSGGDMTADYDVTSSLAATYGITWTTADPFWRGEEIAARFVNDAGGSFFPGPPFTITPGLTLQDPTIVNPGDIDAYPVWRIEGPFTAFSVGIGDSLVEMTLTKLAGQFVEIDMRPHRLTIRDEAGADRWDDVTEVSFSSIPPGQTTLTTTVTGAGTGSALVLTFTPRYRRAW